MSLIKDIKRINEQKIREIENRQRAIKILESIELYNKVITSPDDMEFTLLRMEMGDSDYRIEEGMKKLGRIPSEKKKK